MAGRRDRTRAPVHGNRSKVFDLMMQGLNTKSIADQLGLTPFEAHAEIKRVLLKLPRKFGN